MPLPTETEANAWNAARNFTDWAALSQTMRQAALVRAGDYLRATYALRPIAADDDAAKDAHDAATFMVARDLAVNPAPLAVRHERAIAKESKELAGMKKSVEYADAPADPYPVVTSLLRNAGLIPGSDAVVIGRMVRR